ncbi:MAG: hypothetical protein ACOYJR_07730 [Acutalibacteraceae bacterium]|jgi:hypothetical protein
MNRGKSLFAAPQREASERFVFWEGCSMKDILPVFLRLFAKPFEED